MELEDRHVYLMTVLNIYCPMYCDDWKADEEKSFILGSDINRTVHLNFQLSALI